MVNDAAVSVYAAKREYDAPRPISMIRYLAFNGLLPGVSTKWTPPSPTPPSPGYPSSTAAYAYAASVVLKRAVSGADAGIAQGIELPVDVAAGKKIGLAAGRAALRR